MSIAAVEKRPSCGVAPFANLRYVAPTDYNARHDRDIVENVLNDALAHFGQRLCWQQRWGIDNKLAAEIADIGRHWGLVFDTEPRRAGYKLTGWKRPPRWTRIRGQLSLGDEL